MISEERGETNDALADAKYRALTAEADRDRLSSLLAQALDHMEFAHYPNVGEPMDLCDPFVLMDEARAALAEKTPEHCDCTSPVGVHAPLCDGCQEDADA